jgi:hypothetical protein
VNDADWKITGGPAARRAGSRVNAPPVGGPRASDCRGCEASHAAPYGGGVAGARKRAAPKSAVFACRRRACGRRKYAQILIVGFKPYYLQIKARYVVKSNGGKPLAGQVIGAYFFAKWEYVIY